jgi:small subunit ribosomal protein S20
VANHKSAIKRIKQNDKRRLRNKMVRSALRTQVNKTNTAIEASGPEAAAQVVKTESMLDKAANKGIIPKKRAARKASRLAKRLNAGKTTQGS